jgi:hypothetical protein
MTGIEIKYVTVAHLEGARDRPRKRVASGCDGLVTALNLKLCDRPEDIYGAPTSSPR